MIKEAERVFNYKFKDKKLLERAFSHPQNKPFATVGDALVKFFIAEILLESGSGKITEDKQAIESNPNLGKFIEESGLHNLIAVENRGAVSEHMRADLFEALIYAMYLDGAKPALLKENVKKVFKN